MYISTCCLEKRKWLLSFTFEIIGNTVIELHKVFFIVSYSKLMSLILLQALLVMDNPSAAPSVNLNQYEMLNCSVFVIYSPGWDSDMSSMLLLVHLLPPSSQGRKRPGKISARQACDSLVKFIKVSFVWNKKGWKILPLLLC